MSVPNTVCGRADSRQTGSHQFVVTGSFGGVLGKPGGDLVSLAGFQLEYFPLRRTTEFKVDVLDQSAKIKSQRLSVTQQIAPINLRLDA